MLARKLSGLIVLSLVAVSAEAATPRLEPIEGSQIRLTEATEQVREAILDTDRGVLWVRDYVLDEEGFKSNALEAYSLQGELLEKIEGEEAGFFRIVDIDLDGEGRLWAVDFGGRLKVFERPFDVSETYLATASGPYPYYPGAVALDSKRQLAFVTGCFPLGETLSHGCLEVHAYKLPRFEKSDSFLETPPSPGNARLASRVGLVAVEESSGAVYYARLAAPKIYRLAPPDWTSEELSLGDWSFPTSRYKADWLNAEKITALVKTSGPVAVGIERPRDHEAAVVFFSPDGELLGGIDPAPGRLVGKTSDGDLLFAERVDGDWVISRFAVR